MAATEPTGEEALAEQAGTATELRCASCSSFAPSRRNVCLYLRTRSRRVVRERPCSVVPNSLPRDNKMRITLVALLVACSAALRCSPQYRPLAQRRCSIVAQAELDVRERKTERQANYEDGREQ